MTKDEAKAAVMRLMRAECTCGIPGVKEPCFACEMSAGLDVLAQAAANADTLGLLEALAKRDEGDDSREIPWAEFGRGTRSPSVAVSGYQEGLRYFRVDEDGTEHPISRAEAEALLGDHPHG